MIVIPSLGTYNNLSSTVLSLILILSLDIGNQLNYKYKINTVNHAALKREGAVVILFETKTTEIQLKKELQH